MPLGAFAPMPLRLGRDFTAAQHARLAADLLAARWASPLLVLTFTLTSGVITRHDYLGMNGEGLAYAPTGATSGTGVTTWNFATQSFEDPYETVFGITPRSGIACPHGTVGIIGTVTLGGSALFTVRTFLHSGVAQDSQVTVTIW